MEIILLIIGAILGVLVNELWTKFKYRNSNKKRYKNAVGKVRSIGFVPEAGFKYLDHAIPKYTRENLKTTLSEERLIISVPESYKSFFDEHNFEIRSSTINKWKEQLNKTFNFLKVENYEIFLENCANDVAENIKKDLNQGLQRFNGEMLGVLKIQLQRIGELEQSSLNIKFYKTDFFTYRVFAKAYEKLKDRFEISGIQDLNNYYTPFLSSFGIANYLIIDDGKEDKILFGYRSNNVAVDKNKIHFSMNEAFSLQDIDSTENYNNLSLDFCLKRGLREELGISSEIQKNNLEDFGFMSLAMDMNRFEIGLSSYARLRIDENFKISDLERAYQSAQDGELETKSVNLKKISEVEEYVERNFDGMSVSARNVINTLLARYKSGYFK